MKRTALAVALFIAGCGGDSGGSGGAPPAVEASAALYDENTFATYSFTIAAADWDAIVANPNDSTWRRVTLDWQGEVVQDVAMRPSGNTTRVPGNPKPSVRLDFNEFVPDRKWRSVTQINLDGLTRDRSFMRDRLAYEVFRRMGVPAPRSSHARVVVNGVYKGVYEVEEPIKKPFLKHWWGENDGKLYRPDRIDPYIYRGTDPASYVPAPYEPQTDDTVGIDQPVVTLCTILNNTPIDQRRAELEAQVMNVEALLLYLAASNAMVDFDNANGFFGPHNHYWYHRIETGKFEIIVWDPEMTFGGIGGLIWFLGLPGENMWVRFANSALTSWIPGDPVARASYKAKVRQAVDGPFTMLPARIDFIYNQIKDAVYADPHKPMPNAEFDGAPQAIKNWITSRTASLETQLAAP